MQIPRRKSDELRRKDEGPLYITKEGLKLLKDKFERLKSRLPALITRTKEAADYGDRSENDEYKLSKALLRRTQGQILQIEYQLKRVVLINSGPNTSGVVQLGSTVVVEINGVRKIFQILGSHETNPFEERISFKSPLGAALIGHKKGETVTIQTKSGPQKYIIVGIR